MSPGGRSLFAPPLSLEGRERLQPNAERARGRSPGSSLHPQLVFPEKFSSDIVSVVGDYSGGAVLLTGYNRSQRSQSII